jgi:hypothetical protein
MNRLLKAAVLASFGWNIFLIVGVITNQSYATTRAAGGQFESFPTGIRATYCITLAIVIYQLEVLFTNIRRPEWIYKVFFFLGLSSVLVNAISRSADERWNVIPAAIIAFAFWKRWKSQKA